jgi:crotonobetainyl-CoA:carnitine CoA-transferase CaiB-like acyl-CoA transferase
MPPLAGLKVVELARILAGPWAGQLLADLGAEVVKVESLSGDDTRQWGPPFVDNVDGSRDAAYFHSTNRGKRSIAVDFSKPAGREIVLRLVADADVLVENFKVGGLRAYGLDYPSLSARNPRLVYCSITGFGQDGPEAHRPGYDFMIQAMGGLMSLTGPADGAPHKVGVAFADIFAGVYSVVAIEAALLHRERTGRGQYIDMALLDTQVGVLANQALNYLVSGASPKRMGNAHPNIVPYQEFATIDGHAVIAVGNDKQFAALCRVLGVPDLATDDRYAHNHTRVKNRGSLIAVLSQRVATFRRDDLLAALGGAGVPAGPINALAEVFGEPQVVHRGMRRDVKTADGVSIPGVRSPIVMAGSPLTYEKAAPRLGEHANEILAGLGYSNDEMEQLREEGVVGYIPASSPPST